MPGPFFEPRVAWGKIGQLFVLHPFAALSECPTCKHIGRRAEPLCRYCGETRGESVHAR